MEKPLGGLTNNSYLIKDPVLNLALVIRLQTLDTGLLGLDWQRESLVLQSVSQTNLTPQIYHHDSQALVTRFVKGRLLSASDRTPNNLSQLASAFRTIHDTPCPQVTQMVLTDECHRYFANISQPRLKKDLTGLHAQITARIHTGLNALQSLGLSDPCLCHHDLTPENLLLTSNGIQILDWEYARQGNAVYDLAVFIETMGLDQTGETDFLNSYGISLPAHLMSNFRLAYRYLELLWWLARQGDMNSHCRSLLTRIRLSLMHR